MATIACIGCSVELEVPEDRSTWDVTTEIQGGFEVVVERHVSITCESCGTTAHPFLPYGSDEAAYGGRAGLSGDWGHLGDESGVIHEVANIVRETVDPPEPFGGHS